MTTDLSLEQQIAESLNLYCFQNIWNEPESEFRNNVVLEMIGSRSHSGNIYIGGKNLPLPTNNAPYYIYFLATETMYGVTNKFLPNAWISTEEICNKYDILLSTYHLSGRMMHKGYTYLYTLPNRGGYLLAIDKSMSSFILEYDEMKDMRLTIYYDSDIISKITSKTWRIPVRDDSFTERQKVLNYLASCNDNKNHVTLFVNGYETKLLGSRSIPLDSFIDVIHDENTLITFDVDLTNSSENFAFYSDKDKVYKQIIHIPKGLNPDNKVFTHNTMEIYVRSKLKNNVVGNGVYLHRCAERSVTQITHNDVAISTIVLDAFRDHLENQDIYLHVIVRQHEKDNVLIRDKSYIDLLYTQDDKTILQCLTGKIKDSLSFWKASELEKTTYVGMMFDVPDIITPSNVYDYVEGLGYYHTLALLCQRIRHTTITEWFRGALAFNKPLLYQGRRIYPLVYLNGKKINNEYITTYEDDPSYIGVGLKDNISYNLGDILSVEMFLHGYTNIYKFEINENNTTFEVPYLDYTILEEIDTTYIIHGFNKESHYSYEEFTNYLGNVVILPGTTAGFTKFIFGPSMYGKTIIVQNNIRVYRWSKNIDLNISQGDLITIDLHYCVNGSVHEVPIWYTPNTIVYLNGKYLTENIDYTIQESRDYDRRLSMKQVVIQNFQYMKSTDNYIECFTTSAEIENSVNGFMIDDKAYSESELALLFENMTMFHIDGNLEPNVINKGSYIEVPKDKYREGAVFEVLTSVPSIIKKFLLEYHSNDDIERIKILNDYFYGKRDLLPDIIVLPDQHKVYSIYIAAIIRDIVNNSLSGISFDPDAERMKDQLLRYQYIANADLVLQDNNYDLRFVNVYPHYRNFTITDINKKRVIEAFINIILPKDKFTTGNTATVN